MICPFCKKEAIWCQNKEIYGRNYGKSFMVWLCKPCKSWVGTHNNTKKPLGTMANEEMRRWRLMAHKTFDPIWRSGTKSRNSAYRMLKNHFKKEIHIGESDVETCKQIIEFVNSRKK